MRNVCESCSECLKSFVSCYVTFAKYLSISFCCCMLGMALMSLALLVYYGLFITFIPVVVTEHPDVDKHKSLNSYIELKPETDSEDDSLYVYSDTNEARDTGYRQRRIADQGVQSSIVQSERSSSSRPFSTSMSSNTSKTKADEKQATDSVSTTTEKFKITKAKFHIGHQTTSSTTEHPDTIPDFQLSNHLIDSVFRTAEAAGMKESLGLCRKNADVKVPEVKATLFPSEQAGDILNCINDLLRNQTKKQICLHLDPEMNAYLKWLLTTGESRERHKPVQINSKEDFLFPSTCVSTSETDSAGIATTQCFVEPQARMDDFRQK